MSKNWRHNADGLEDEKQREAQWCLKTKEPFPAFWFPDNEKYPFKETGDMSDEITSNGRFKVQLLYDDTTTATDTAGQGQSVIASVNENAARAANAKHASTNSIKERFIAFYQADGSNYPSKKAAAESYFDGLDMRTGKLLFASKKTATHTLLDGLRAHLGRTNPPK